MADDYLVGVASADITPPVGTPLCGYAFRGVHESTGVYHPLTATAVVIDDGTTTVLLVSAEWLGFYDRTAAVRRRLSAATGLPAAQIILTGTHTHCGPAVRARDAELHGRIDQDYLTDAAERMAAAATAALAGRSRVSILGGTGRCELAVSRRLPDPDHPSRVLPGPNPYPDGPHDHQTGVLRIESAAGDVRAVLFSYACHPTARAGTEIGGDYVGFALDRVSADFGRAVPIFLQGCAGDQSPRPVRPGRFDRRTVDQVRALGNELAGAVRDTAVQPVSGPISTARTVLELETEPDDSGRHDRVPFEIQTVSFGSSLAVIAMAGEMTVEHGLRLKRELGGRFGQVLPLGYAGDLVGYVPVRRQFAELGYEVLGANLFHGRTGRYVESTEDRIHQQIHTMLDHSCSIG